jgi:lipoprotein-anchoring transpeptidase ErfK/SrfK
LIAYEDDTPVFATLIASGLPGTDTHEGLFTIWARVANDTMSGFAGAPNSYALQSVPWVMYFDGSISLHGTYWHDLFGFRRSRGCVNLTISDAHWLFEWSGAGEPNEDGDIITYVYVFASGDYHGDGPQTK